MQNQKGIAVNRLRLANRLVMAPMATNQAPGGQVTEGHLFHYSNRSRGGVFALVETEHCCVRNDGRASGKQLSVATDAALPGLMRLADAVHQNDAKIFCQISHAGSCASQAVTGCVPMGPSAVVNPGFTSRAKEMPRAMRQTDIDGVVAAFADAARRVRAAGFDGVEIHAAHGYLLNQFYSPITNRRDDTYSGKTLAGRIRLHLQIIAAVRRAVGEDYPVALRLGACDHMDGGSTLADAAAAAQAFEAAGIDMISVSGGLVGYILKEDTRPGYFAPEARAIKAAVAIPVMLTGGVTSARDAQALIDDQAADLIGIGRAVLKDPDWGLAQQR